MSLITGSPVRWFVLGFNNKRLSGRTIKKHIDGSVSLFLRAYSSSPPKEWANPKPIGGGDKNGGAKAKR
jgi:hypothetical protein